MSYSLYGSFSIEEAHAVGKRFKAKCKANYEYEDCLTMGKEYELEIIPEILTCSPLCSLIGDGGKEVDCYLTRFDKIEELK